MDRNVVYQADDNSMSNEKKSSANNSCEEIMYKLRNTSELDREYLEFVESHDFLNVDLLLYKNKLSYTNLGHDIRTSTDPVFAKDSGTEPTAQEFPMDTNVTNFPLAWSSKETLAKEYPRRVKNDQALYPNSHEERSFYNMEIGPNLNSEDWINKFQQICFTSNIRRCGDSVDMQIFSNKNKAPDFDIASEMMPCMIVNELETSNTLHRNQKQNRLQMNHAILLSNQPQDYGSCAIRNDTSIYNENQNMAEKVFLKNNHTDYEIQLNEVSQKSRHLSYKNIYTSNCKQNIPMEEYLQFKENSVKSINLKNRYHDFTTRPNVYQSHLKDILVSKADQTVRKEYFFQGRSIDMENISNPDIFGSLESHEHKNNQSACGRNVLMTEVSQEHELHNRGTSITADICLKKLQETCNLNRDKIISMGNNRYESEICEQMFSQKSYLVRQNRNTTGEKRFICNTCSKPFSRKISLEKHSRIHSGEKPFICNICHKTFSQKATLKRHVRIHNGEKPFSCQICFRAFTTIGSLDAHVRTHSREKPFSCDICHKTFSYQSSLKQHMRKHSGEKPFQCADCGKAFTTKYHLKRHAFVHTGEKPSKC